MKKLAKGGKILSYVFSFMIIASVVFSAVFGNTKALSQAITDGAYEAVTLIISLVGMMCLWSGIMEVAKESGLTKIVAKGLSAFLRPLFRDVKKDSKAFEYICMNVSANLLGLGNCATPLGLKAISELNKENNTDTASDSMITLVVMNTASLSLVPTTVCTLRSVNGSKNPFDIIACVWVTSLCALGVALVSCKLLSGFVRKKCTL